MRSIQHHVHVLLARSAMGDPNIDQRLAKDQRRQRRSRLPILLPSTDGDVIALGGSIWWDVGCCVSDDWKASLALGRDEIYTKPNAITDTNSSIPLSPKAIPLL